jgi:hypothetical protein
VRFSRGITTSGSNITALDNIRTSVVALLSTCRLIIQLGLITPGTLKELESILKPQVTHVGAFSLSLVPL